MAGDQGEITESIRLQPLLAQAPEHRLGSRQSPGLQEAPHRLASDTVDISRLYITRVYTIYTIP